MDRLLVVIPNWVGDVVLASPVLGALREHFRGAHITYLMRPYVAEIVAGGGWHDGETFWPVGRGWQQIAQTRVLAGQLRRERFDLAMLLTNSFRSALVVRMAGIPHRVGYARDLRGWLLTDRLRPLRKDGQYVPSPVLPYYIKLAEQVGCPVTDRRLRVGVTPRQEEAGRELLRAYHLDHGAGYAAVNPGAAFGAAKCWAPERFAQVCDRLEAEHGLRPVLVGAAHEGALMRRIAEMSRARVVCCDRPATTLGSLKVLIRQAAILVCNDTGPRHYGNAFGVPTVTIFGPTHQAWTDTEQEAEVKLQVPVDCGPCQLKTCPIDHRCLTRLSVDQVMEAVSGLLTRRGRRADDGAHTAAARM